MITQWKESAAPEPFAGASETHSAVVYFAGNRACKLKKPVRLGFLDFSTVLARAQACARETELNRRFAPDVYLGVAEVRDEAGEACDHLVVMRRMPANRRLAALIQAGEAVEGPVRQVARILAAQHASAERGGAISEQGSRDVTRHRWQDNLEQLGAAPGSLLDKAELNEIARLAEQFLAGRQRLFDTRCDAGRIVDGHGDLLADDIFCLDDGPRVLDCLDFDDRLRWVDGLDDAAFLAMDLEQLGAVHLAGRFMRWYSEYSGDRAPAALVHHFVAYRALVRAKVGCIRAGQGSAAAPAEARHLTAAATRHLRAGAVTLVLVGGLPGTGKTGIAGKLAEQLGFPVLSSDRIRKELAGMPPEEPVAAEFGDGIYARSWTERTYSELLSRAARLLAMGESVLIDATWASAEHRRAAAELAARTSTELVQLQCTAPAQLAASRILARGSGASDATPAIAARMAAEQAPWPEALVIDTSGEDQQGSEQPDPVQSALVAVRPHGPEHVWHPARPYMLPDLLVGRMPSARRSLAASSRSSSSSAKVTSVSACSSRGIHRSCTARRR